jgi:ABC-2 type transport system ATP-binding protein
MTDNQNEVIKISGLKKKFGDFEAVKDLSFSIHEDEIFGFLGPNGAGKTTTVNMICGLLKPTVGEIIIYDKKIRDNKEIKSMIGICPQENVYWKKLTCLEQLIFTGQSYDLSYRESKQNAMDLLQLLGLSSKKNVLADKLSGGMKRRLNICLALIHDPKIIILDEPEAGLDPQSRILVRNFIKSLAKVKTVILTTHNMDEADRLADRVAIIDRGQLLMLDTPENLKKSTGKGDLLEIMIDKDHKNNLNVLSKLLSEKYEQVKLTDHALVIRSKNLIESVPTISNLILDSGFKIRQMTMRENTLEDVFIHLTGKKLRQ